MYKYFKINDPVRPIIACLILITFGLVNHFLSSELTTLELEWMLSGERLRNGWLPYVDTFTTIAPLSQCVYALIDLVAGRSALMYRLVGIIALLFQLVYLSGYLIQNETLKEKTYLIVIILCSLFLAIPGLVTAFPALMGNVFVVAAFAQMIKQLKKQMAEEEYFLSGFLFGIATLFFIPYLYLGIAGIIYLLIYSQTVPRKLLVMLFGLFFPLICVTCLYYWNNSIGYLIGYVYMALLPNGHWNMPNWWIISPFLLFAFTNIIGFWRNRQLINYQLVCRQLHGVWLILCCGMALLYDNTQTGNFGITAMPLAFFVVQSFPEIKRKGLRNFLFASTVLYGIVLSTLFALNKLTNEFSTKTDKTIATFSNKRTLVLGDQIDWYEGNIPATKYLNWELSLPYFSQPNDYGNVLAIYKSLGTEFPEKIVDPSNLMEAVFNIAPSLKAKYTLDAENRVYTLISN